MFSFPHVFFVLFLSPCLPPPLPQKVRDAPTPPQDGAGEWGHVVGLERPAHFFPPLLPRRAGDHDSRRSVKSPINFPSLFPRFLYRDKDPPPPLIASCARSCAVCSPSTSPPLRACPRPPCPLRPTLPRSSPYTLTNDEGGPGWVGSCKGLPSRRQIRI